MGKNAGEAVAIERSKIVGVKGAVSNHDVANFEEAQIVVDFCPFQNVMVFTDGFVNSESALLRELRTEVHPELTFGTVGVFLIGTNSEGEGADGGKACKDLCGIEDDLSNGFTGYQGIHTLPLG